MSLETIADTLGPAYAGLARRAVEVYAADDRVRAVWATGSLARGITDAASDLDLLLTVRDDGHEGFCARWREVLGRIDDPLLARALPWPPGSFTSVMPGWLRLDVLVERQSDQPSTPVLPRLPLHDPDGLAATLPPTPELPGPSADAVRDLVEEFLRCYGLAPVSVRRDDWFVGLEGVYVLRNLLFQLWLQENAPLPPGGVKRKRALLTDDQAALLEVLPVGAPNRRAIIQAHQAIGAVFLREARRISRQVGAPWPSRLEQATHEHLADELGIEPPVG